MKKILSLIAASLIILTACTKSSQSPTETIRDTVNTTQPATYRGTFINGPYGSTTGVVKIYDSAGVYSLLLDSFNVNNGPDLHVYLSKEQQPVNFIDLGKLRSTNGTQLYNINGSPDFSEYKYALIHCQQYNHLFGSASLQ